MLDVYTFLEREFPTLLERWEREHQKGRQIVKQSH
jgi:hypothetical protein